MRSALRMVAVAISACLLAGCADLNNWLGRAETVYAFGAAQSCFPTPEPAKCERLKAYDTIEIAFFPQKQEISYVRRGLGLDQDNVIFKKLNNCTVIDNENYSCDGLRMVDGDFTDTSEYRNVRLVDSFIAYSYSYYLGGNISGRTLDFLHRHNSWIQPAAVIFALIAVLALLSG